MITLNETAIQLFEQWSESQQMIEDLVLKCCEQLNVDPPQIQFQDDNENASVPLGKTAYYSPSEQLVVVYVSNRHIKDIMRSIAHELVHHKQMTFGELDLSDPMQVGYAQENDSLRKSEEEAYLKGNMMFRDWEDSIKKRKKNKMLENVRKMDNKKAIKLIQEATKRVRKLKESSEGGYSKITKKHTKKYPDDKHLAKETEKTNKDHNKEDKAFRRASRGLEESEASYSQKFDKARNVKDKKLQKSIEKGQKTIKKFDNDAKKDSRDQELAQEEVKRGVEGPKQKARQKSKERKDQRKDDREIKGYMDRYHSMKDDEDTIDVDYSIEENVQEEVEEACGENTLKKDYAVQKEADEALNEMYSKFLGERNYLKGLKKTKLED